MLAHGTIHNLCQSIDWLKFIMYAFSLVQNVTTEVFEPSEVNQRRPKRRKMTDLGFGGRVLAGEDSEEDESEEELGFQFGGFAPQPPPVVTSVQPKFSVPAPVVQVSGEDSESDEEEEDDGGASVVVTQQISKPSTPVAPTVEDEEQPTVAVEEKQSVREVDTDVEKDQVQEVWTVEEGVDGSAIMGQAIIRKLEPSLDETIRRIAELTESQQRLLVLLSAQNKAVCSNTHIDNIAIVMSKLPQYVKKVQDMKERMNEVTLSVERMKKRAENLRVDAQSHAIKKENKRESRTQWNKLYAAKSTGTTTMTSMFSTASYSSASSSSYPGLR